MRFFALTFLLLSVAGAASAQTPRCDIGEDKKRLIVSILCGAAAKEQEYKITGPNCIRESTRVRFMDSAAQIVAYGRCGDQPFADRLKEGTLKAAQFTQLLAACSNEKFDARHMMNDALMEAQLKSGSFQCTPDMKSLLARRRADFEVLIKQSDDSALQARIFERLKVTVDSAGNIREAP